MRFDDYRKDLRNYSNTLNVYSSGSVKKNFYKSLSALGKLDGNDRAVFITIRLKVKSDWVACNGVIDGLWKKVSKFWWGRKSRYQLLPFVASIETVDKTRRIQDHIHMIIRLTEPNHYLSDIVIRDRIIQIAKSFDEINENDLGSVNASIFPFTDASPILGNLLEYICKSSTKENDPIVIRPFTRKQIQKRVATQL